MSKIAPAKAGTRSATRSRASEFAATRSLSPITSVGWNLPSGESLADFALRLGFLAPPLLESRSGRISKAVRRNWEVR